MSNDIALIPSAEHRLDLALIAKGISFSWALVKKVSYRSDQQRAAADLGKLGFELISSWMRDERTIDSDLKKSVVDLETQLLKVHKMLSGESTS